MKIYFEFNRISINPVMIRRIRATNLEAKPEPSKYRSNAKRGIGWLLKKTSSTTGWKKDFSQRQIPIRTMKITAAG